MGKHPNLGDPMDIEAVAKDVVDAAIHVHRALGPGLLESAYQRAWRMT